MPAQPGTERSVTSGTPSVVVALPPAIAAEAAAVTAMERGDANTALREYTHALELDPNRYPAYVERSKIHTCLGNLDAAIADARNAFTRQPDIFAASHAQVRTLIIDNLITTGKLAEAYQAGIFHVFHVLLSGKYPG